MFAEQCAVVAGDEECFTLFPGLIDLIVKSLHPGESIFSCHVMSCQPSLTWTLLPWSTNTLRIQPTIPSSASCPALLSDLALPTPSKEETNPAPSNGQGPAASAAFPPLSLFTPLAQSDGFDPSEIVGMALEILPSEGPIGGSDDIPDDKMLRCWWISSHRNLKTTPFVTASCLGPVVAGGAMD
jgi:hypothetical protein